MCDENDNLKDQTIRVTEWLKWRMRDLRRYHDHKESMAHAAMLLSAGISGWIFTKGLPDWAKDSSALKPFIAGFVVIGLLVAVHVWMRWQFRNRRAAASLHSAIVAVLWKWSQTPPSDKEIKPGKVNQTPGSSTDEFLDKYAFPCSRVAPSASTIIFDAWPEALTKEYHPEKPDALYAERLVSWGNLVLILLVLARLVT